MFHIPCPGNWRGHQDNGYVIGGEQVRFLKQKTSEDRANSGDECAASKGKCPADTNLCAGCHRRDPLGRQRQERKDCGLVMLERAEPVGKDGLVAIDAIHSLACLPGDAMAFEGKDVPARQRR
jgi:hypothetical protein